MNLDEVLLRDGTEATRIRIEHPEAAAIVPFLSEKEIIFVRQYRYALGRETLEIPAGKLDPSEKPEECAGRELLEETGYQAATLTLHYTYAPAIGYSNELIHIYAGRNLRRLETAIDQREISSVEVYDLKAIRSLIQERKIMDGKTLLGLAVMGLLHQK